MEILKISVLRGPNYWSDEHTHLVVARFDPVFEKGFVVKEKNFEKKLRSLIPSFETHKEELDFSVNSDEGRANLVAQVAAELQELAGMRCELKESYLIENGLYCIVFSYEIENAGVYALRAALRLILALMAGDVYDVSVDISRLNRIKFRGLGPTTSFLLEEIKKRKIPYMNFPRSSLMMLGYGIHQKQLRTAVAGTTSALGLEIAGDKEETRQLLAEVHAPVPKGLLVYDEEDLKESIDLLRFPVVTKPINGNHGRGITTNIKNLDEAIFGYRIASQVSRTVIVEEFIEGFDFRLLVVNFKFTAVAMRTPAYVKGDGRSTIEELIDIENTNPERGDGPEHVLATIKVDEITKKILDSKKLDLNSVLPAGQTLYLKDTANISMGGTATDLTDVIHPYNKFLAERIARIFNLDICGIDLIAKSVEVPITRDNGAIIEVNAGPGLRMHSNPNTGTGRNVAKPIVEMLFPEKESPTIPITAIAGDEDAAAITRLIARIATASGFKSGYATKDGIFIQEHQLSDSNGTYYENANAVLFDPTINFAVLQCDANEIMHEGLPFDKCNISIIADVPANRQTKVKGIITEDELKIKIVVAQNTLPEGYCILNAENPKLYELKNELLCKAALFGSHTNEDLKAHCASGGLGATYEKGEIVIYDGKWKTRIGASPLIPFKLNGDSTKMYNVILPSVLAAYIQNLGTEHIQNEVKAYFSAIRKKHVPVKKAAKRKQKAK